MMALSKVKVDAVDDGPLALQTHSENGICTGQALRTQKYDSQTIPRNASETQTGKTCGAFLPG